MTPRTTLRLLLALFMMVWISCGGCFGIFGDDEPSGSATDEQTDADTDADAATESDEPQSMAEAMEQAGRALDQLSGGEGDGKAVEPVNFRRLRDLMPDELAGIERTSLEGQSSGMAGVKVSMAEAEYQEDNARLKLTITDMGTLTGIARMGMAWMNFEVDKESDSGFERTTKYKGFPAFEECNRRSDDLYSCNFQFFVGDRFAVGLEGQGVSVEQMEEARDDVPTEPLEDMKDESGE